MSVELLVQATTHRKAEKGYVEVIKDGRSAVWGSKEGLPNWVRIVISDLDVSDVEHLTGEWKNKITWTKIRDVAVGREQYRLQMPNNTVLRDSTKGVNNEIDTYLKINYSGSRVSREPDQSSAEYNLLIPNLQDMKNDLLDKFEETVVRRRFKLAESDVDAAIAAGGVLHTTAASGIIDRQIDGQA